MAALHFPTLENVYTVRDRVGLPETVFTASTSWSTERWRADYEPYGAIRSSTGSASYEPPFRFLGQLALAESDQTVWSGTNLLTLRPALHLNQWRVYDPSMGQYLTAEPLVVGDVQLNNPYGYAHANAQAYVDGDGRNPGAALGAAAGNPVAWGLAAGFALWCYLNQEACANLIDSALDDFDRLPGGPDAPTMCEGDQEPKGGHRNNNDSPSLLCVIRCGIECQSFPLSRRQRCIDSCIRACMGRGIN